MMDGNLRLKHVERLTEINTTVFVFSINVFKFRSLPNFFHNLLLFMRVFEFLCLPLRRLQTANLIPATLALQEGGWALRPTSFLNILCQ